MKGKIYKLTCNNKDFVYIGSTTTELKERLYYHNYSYKNKDKLKYTCSSVDLYNYGNVEIKLIEEFEINNIKELHEKERYYIDNIKCINKAKPLRKFNEWLESKDEEYKKRRKERYLKKNCSEEQYKRKLENKRKNSAIRVKCELCNKEMRKDQLSRHKIAIHNIGSEQAIENYKKRLEYCRNYSKKK